MLLTDGENDVSGGGNGINKSYYNAFGYAKNGHLGNTNGSNAEATLDTKTLAVCSAIKKRAAPRRQEDIQLYTIGFQVTSASQTLLEGLRDQARHVLQLADQRSARRHLPGHRARLERAAHRAIGVRGSSAGGRQSSAAAAIRLASCLRPRSG